MNQTKKNPIVERLGINEHQRCIIINQVTKAIKTPKDEKQGNHRFLSYKEKGLSRSRNRALDNAVGDICLISDDDCSYVKEYEEIITKAYKKYRDADIIVFDFMRANGAIKTIKKKKVGFLYSMKISSVQITFKKKSIERAKIKFDEGYGTGSTGPQWGEENIFLFDCLRAGLKIYHVPTIILKIQDLGTTWDRNNTPERYMQQGAVFYRMSPRFWRVLALQFTLRKRKMYIKDMSSFKVFTYMVKGAKEYSGR